jgi:UDP-GlcNAc:undecaprenyl-phosphate GlcNAc-1-phosphate transferase
MAGGLLAGLIATIVAALLTPFVRRIARDIGAVDAPGGRHVHAGATPRLGGVAIFLAYFVAVLTCLSTGLLKGNVWQSRGLTGFLIAGLLIALAGMIDDLRALGAKRKLLVQCLAVTIAWFFGVRIDPSVFVPGIGMVHIGEPLSYLATLCWTLAFINAINLIDGLDGLAGGVVFFATVTNLTVAIVTGNVFAAVLNAALGGAVLGFLFYNFNPATIFMGDTGSMFLGYALGSAALMSGQQKESTLVSLLVPVIALGLPLADTLLAMVRRILARRSIFSADRGHLHHRLLDLGLTHRRAVLILYGCSILLCLAALGAAVGKDWQVGLAITGAVVTLFGVIRFAGYFELALLRTQQRALLLSGPAEALRRSLPPLIINTRNASSPAGVWAELESLLDAGPFVYAEYRQTPGEQPVWSWQTSTRSRRKEGKLSESEFAIRAFPGAKEGVLRFECLCDESPMPPQIEMMLQLIADTVESALVQINVETPSILVRAVSS